MSDNDATPTSGKWALWTAIFGWLAPMGTYFVLHMQFQSDPIWGVAGPYLMVAFTLLAVLAQVAALFIAAIAWPAKSALWAVVVALALFAWNAALMAQGLRSLR